MAVSVNLLPWRHLQRQQRQRCRISVMVSVIALLISSLWVEWFVLSQRVGVVKKQERELENQQRRLQDILHQQQGERLQDKRQYRGKEQLHRISRWEDILTKLANKLPESSRLQMLNWQSNTLTLEGYTSEIDDLEKIETLLKQLPGVFHIKTGPVRYQEEQGLAYTFIMEDTGGAFVSP